MTTTVSSVTNHFPSAENGFTTTLSSTISSGATTVGVNSLSGYANGEIAVFVVAPSVASEKQTFTGVVDTAGLQLTSVVWTSGTNQAHSAGTTVVDYATATHISMMSKGILVEHDQDGTHGAITPTSVTTGALTATTSTLTNVTLGTSRLDTGWFPGSSTWVYASATTFTVSATEAAFMSVGTKIWLTQTTSKYFYVIGVSGTTITVTGGSDYTVANAVITAPYYSNAATPFGFPQYFNFAPAWSNFTIGTGGSAATTAMFTMTGKTVMGWVTSVLGNSGQSVGANPAFTAPVTATSSYNSASNTRPVGDTRMVAGGGGFSGNLLLVSTTSIQPVYNDASIAGISSTSPGTWAAGNYIAGEFTYQAA